MEKKEELASKVMKLRAENQALKDKIKMLEDMNLRAMVAKRLIHAQREELGLDIDDINGNEGNV